MFRSALWLLAIVACTACGARSELDTSSPDDLSCPLNGFSTPVRAPTHVVIDGPGWAAGHLVWSVVSQPEGGNAMVQSDGALGAEFVADMPGPYVLRVTRALAPTATDAGGSGVDAGIATAAPGASCEVYVTVLPRAPAVICPDDVTTEPLHAVLLAARPEADRGVATMQWTVLDSPRSSSLPSPSPPDQPTTSFRPDVVGDYLLQFTTTDLSGAQAQCQVTVHAVSRDAVHVEIFWNNPDRSCERFPNDSSCDPTDVDLHLLHDSRGQWVRTPDDCYYANCKRQFDRVQWDDGGDEDPHLDIDHVNGFGPENINVHRAGSRSYRVGVHFFDGHGRQDADVTVLIYCGGQSTPVRTFGPTRLHAPATPPDNDFWLVADVLVQGTSCAVLPIARDDGSNWIEPQIQARTDPGPPPP